MTQSTFLNLGRDIQGYPTKGAQFATDMFSATLAANTAHSFTVPSTHQIWLLRVKVQPAQWVWVNRTGTATVPAGATFASTASAMAVGTLLNEWVVSAADVISMVSANGADVGVELYPISFP